MKTVKKIILTSILLSLFFFLQGCAESSKADNKEDQQVIAENSKEETQNTNQDNAKDAEQLVENEMTEETASADESAMSCSIGDKLTDTVSWKLIKEILPKEKKLNTRFVGFYDDSFGISTAKYGILYYTTDGGETWTAGRNTSACIAGLEIIDKNNAFITANNSQVRVSKDGGASWEAVPDFGDMANEHCRYLSFIDANTGWIANKKEVGFTIDGGLSWAKINTPASMSDISAIWLNTTQEGYILSNAGILYSTMDGGATWTESNMGINGMYLLVCPTAVLRVQDQQSFQIVAFIDNGTEKGYYYFSTTDGGNSWEKCECIKEGEQGFLHLNRDGSMLTITDDKDKTIMLYEFIK